ncbi:hypothetical protein BH24ACT7_BH24ACT7_09790 [soil metagenome]
MLAGDTDPTVATLPPPTTTAAQVTDITGGPECATGDLDFVDDGVIATMGTGSADAAAVNELRWDTELGCDRFVVGFATAGGSPASSLGPTTVELLPGRGILRVRLPTAVVATSLAEATVDGTVITRAVVVGLIEGSLAIDLHLDATRGCGPGASSLAPRPGWSLTCAPSAIVPWSVHRRGASTPWC